MNNQAWGIKLSTLDKRIKAFSKGYRQNLSILGDSQEETTSLLENYFSINKIDELTYLHATTRYGGRKEFFKALAFSLLSDHFNTIGPFDSVVSQGGEGLAQTTDFIKDTLTKKEITFLDSLELINKYINESKKRCVLIIEEFLGLENLFEDFYQDFSRFIILQRSCMIVLTASSTKDAEKVLSGELNLLFGNFEKVFLNENDYLKNFLYFKHLIEPIEPSPFFLSFFVSIIGPNVLYYNLLAKTVKDNYFKDDECKSILEILKKSLYCRENYFFQKFIQKVDLIKINFKDYSNVLELILFLAKGYMRKKELTSLGIYNSKDINTRLQKLIDLNYVQNLGNIYKIKDSLFSFWLRIFFDLRFSLPTIEISKRQRLVDQRLKEELDLSKDEFFRDKLKKILELFSAFKNDSLRLGKNRYSLPSVESIKVVSSTERNLHFLVGEGREIIFAGVKEKDVEDNDIFEFIEKGTNIKGKRVKKIFISLDNLPSAARVIAKNNKLILWDVNEINRLLYIYNKPMVSYNL